VMAIWLVFAFSVPHHASPPGGMIYPKANEEATEKLKEAYAAYHQGWYDRAIELAMEVYRKYGNVHARWWPAWAKRMMKGNLPDPHDQGAILRATIEGEAPLTMTVKGTLTAWLLSQAYLDAGRFRELVKAPWGDPILKGIAGLKLKRGERPPQPPPKNTWRPLTLRYREEDYFILVPLDEACKVLGIPYQLKRNPKTGKPAGAYIGKYIKEKRPLLVIQEALRIGAANVMAYPAYEEDGVIWIPFYWLAKEAGIKWWEVKNGRIYVAPNK